MKLHTLKARAGLAAGICAASLLTGCAATAPGPEFTELESPQPGESLIYYLRGRVGEVTQPAVVENGVPVCKLQDRGYFAHHTTPGEKHITVDAKWSSDLYLTAEEGQRYFIYGDGVVTPGGLLDQLILNRVRLCEIDEETALPILKDAKQMEAVK